MASRILIFKGKKLKRVSVLGGGFIFKPLSQCVLKATMLIENYVILCLIQSQIVFNRDVVNCLRTTRPKDSLQSKREKLVSILHCLSQLVTSSLVPHQHQTLEALLTIDVHARDVLDSMITNQVYQQEDFQWTRLTPYLFLKKCIYYAMPKVMSS